MNIQISLTPKQTEFDRAIDTYPVTLYGGGKGSGKSHGIREIFLKRRFQYPGTHAAIFRRSYPELESNHIRPLLQHHPDLRPHFNHSKKLLQIPSLGSSIQFCHCKNDQDVWLYQGREFDDLGIEEAGQWTEPMFQTLRGSNRSSKPGIKPRTALTGNPGGIGHQWLKRLFIDRKYNEREDPSDYFFIQALLKDNPALELNDPEYRKRLLAEPSEMLRRAYLDGDWSVAAGQYFSEFSHSVHVIKPLPKAKDQPYPVPTHWPRFGGYDFGFNHPSAIYWMASDGDGNLYVYREHVEARLRIDEQAAIINSYPDSKNIIFHAGRDCWGQKFVAKEGSPPTIAEEFATHHVYLRPANIDRKQGAARIRELLAVRNVGGKTVGPKVFIFNTCPVLIDTIQKLTHDPDDPEDVLKIDADENDPTSGDDAYDGFRYGIMSRPWKALPGKRPWKDSYDSGAPPRPSWQTI